MEWKGWKWYYERKKQLKKIARPIGTREQVKAWKELIELEKLANEQRYKEAMKRNEKDLKRFGEAYRSIYERNKRLYERQWKNALKKRLMKRVIKKPIRRIKRPQIIRPIGLIRKKSTSQPKPKSKQAIIRAKQNLSSPLPQPKPIPKREFKVTVQSKPKQKARFDIKKVVFLALGAFIVLKILRR
ncbi:hypothetical protein VFC49_09180 [Thermococcus sp. SY098]|uniref:hypothetical protein n=1 Tax=Thermococcus sp. SY098 TaxID=3111325 RepID=UPI002D78A9EB|nr:hypothetical protein [Thermococcus sp. SY098]WRS52219.1 hypothetical protein VFC49_09180 [Thermococcus sp. SY098]